MKLSILSLVMTWFAFVPSQSNAQMLTIGLNQPQCQTRCEFFYCELVIVGPRWGWGQTSSYEKCEPLDTPVCYSDCSSSTQ